MREEESTHGAKDAMYTPPLLVSDDVYRYFIYFHGRPGHLRRHISIAARQAFAGRDVFAFFWRYLLTGRRAGAFDSLIFDWVLLKCFLPMFITSLPKAIELRRVFNATPGAVWRKSATLMA